MTARGDKTSLGSRLDVILDANGIFKGGQMTGDLVPDPGIKIDGFDISELGNEIVSARGSKTSLDTRLDVFLNENGTPKPFPIGTRMVFYQASAPTGWAQVTGINDRVLRFVDGNGGGLGGSWTISGLSTNSTGAHSHPIGSHSHSLSNHQHELPFSVQDWLWWEDGSPFGYGSSGGHFQYEIRDGGGSGKPRSLTSATGAGTTGAASGDTASAGDHAHSVNHNGAWRPAYADCIVGEYQG